MNNVLIINGKEIPLTDKQIKMLTEDKNEVDYSKVFEPEDGQEIYYTDNCGRFESGDFISDIETTTAENLRYCTDKNIAEQLRLRELLNRKLLQFSLKNGGHDINFEECKYNKVKHEIFYDAEEECFRTNSCYNKSQNTSYFLSKEIANQAIETIVKPFMVEYPSFVW